MYIDKRSIEVGDINGGNNNFNTGDNVEQSIKVITKNESDLFKQLLEQINQIQDENEKQDAKDNANKLQTAIEQKDKSRAERLFGWLPQAIQTCQAAVGIAEQIQNL